MNPKNTDQLVISKVDMLLESGFIDKDEIVNKVADEYFLSKSIIRRIMKEMTLEMQRKIRVLSKQYEKDANEKRD